MKKLFYLGWWFLRARLFGRKAPLQTVLFISDICNLRCKHCSVYELKNPHNMTYEQVRDHLQKSYDAGSRFVDFEGGEVTIWKDGDKRINDLLDLAKEIGFFSCTITTNAQLPFAGCKADSIWVSLDGDHRVTIPVSCLMGSLLLVLADTLSRSLGSGSALPVGAITSLLGAPFFIAIIFSRKENHKC